MQYAGYAARFFHLFSVSKGHTLEGHSLIKSHIGLSVYAFVRPVSKVSVKRSSCLHKSYSR